MGDMILLADKNSYGYEFAELVKDKMEIVCQEEVVLQNNILKKFRNREIKMRAEENIRGRDVYYIADTTLSPNDWWAHVLLAKDMVLNSSAHSMTLVSPNLFYSRQDRKDESRVPISARAVANSISAGLKKVITMDLHAGQVQGFYPAEVPLDNLYSFPEVSRYFVKEYSKELENSVIVSPGAGGVNRVRSFVNRLEKLSGGEKFGIGFFDKYRPTAGEVGEVRYVGDSFEGRNVFLIDDMIDSGNTLVEDSKYFSARGAGKLYAYGTHGLFTLGPERLIENFETVFTSNTHKQAAHKVGLIDVSKTFAEAIYRAQNNLSISELFV